MVTCESGRRIVLWIPGVSTVISVRNIDPKTEVMGYEERKVDLK